jgi:uncharacterized protein (DUF302 family)
MQKIYLIVFSLFLTWGLTSPVAMAVGPAVNGLITVESAFTVDETVNRLQQAITERGANVAANIDHAANAQSIGQELRPTQLLIFGNPKLGTPLMQSSPTSGIDLPLKFLVWQDETGQVFVSYNDTQYLVDRHKITDQDELIGTISNAMNAFAASVTAGADEVTPPAALPATGGAYPQTPWILFIGVGGMLVGIGILLLRKNSGGWFRMFSILMIPLLAVALLTNITPIQADETNGLVTIDSPHSAEDTVSLLVNEIEGRGLNLVRTVDHQANAQSVGMSLGANTLLIFGNPNLGTGLIQNSQTVGIDLPQKILVWADENGQVKITYNSPQFIGQRHNLSGQDETLSRIANALNAIASTSSLNP